MLPTNPKRSDENYLFKTISIFSKSFLIFIRNTSVQINVNQFLTLLEEGHLHVNIGLTIDPCETPEFTIPNSKTIHLKKTKNFAFER